MTLTARAFGGSAEETKGSRKKKKKQRNILQAHFSNIFLRFRLEALVPVKTRFLSRVICLRTAAFNSIDGDLQAS